MKTIKRRLTVQETITYTIINPDNVQEEERLTIEVKPEEKTFTINGTPIDAQQLAELGVLFFALASRAGISDLDSCNELLDGIPFPNKELNELINIEKEYK